MHWPLSLKTSDNILNKRKKATTLHSDKKYKPQKLKLNYPNQFKLHLIESDYFKKTI